MTQENVKSQGNVYNKSTDINADTTLDLYDTGRQLIVSGTAAVTCTLPPIADVRAGWSVQLLFASDHAHEVEINSADSNILYGMVQTALGAEVAEASGSLALTYNMMGSPVTCSTVEDFCDGTLWHIRGETPNGATFS